MNAQLGNTISLGEVDLAPFNPWEIYCSMPPSLIKHSENVARYTEILYSLSMSHGNFVNKLSTLERGYIRSGVIYHDIGKMMIPGVILYKAAMLTQSEYNYMKRHVEYGMKIMGNSLSCRHINESTQIYLNVVQSAILHHHENFNGTGYPSGLKGNEISFVGQMCSLCDFYDALRMDRVYRKALTHEAVLGMILAERGKKFNPVLVDLFLSHHHLFQQ